MRELKTAMFLMGVTRLEQFDRTLFVEGYGPAQSR
jgi:isopentenyl diphosphate isomerase/L-lactate dehydrogenase-like FMN-dependent dehydrogenase